MRQALPPAFRATLPVMAGYLVLGFGFGLLIKSAGYGVPLAVAMSVCVYAGSMQYVTVGLLTGGASLLTAFLTTVMVNARHLFYGLSMLDNYKNAGARRLYLIFALTDETYSLVCGALPDIAPEHRVDYCFLVSLLDQSYWVAGTLAGAVVGSLVRFNSEGIDFALTALFLTVFLEQWLTSEKHVSALIGVGVSLICLLLFGGGRFLIPSMLVIALLLCLYGDGEEADGDD